MEERNLIPKRMTFTLNEGIKAEKQTFVEVSREMNGLLIRSLATKEEILLEYSRVKDVKIAGILEADINRNDMTWTLIGLFFGNLFKSFSKMMINANKRIPTFNIDYYDEFQNLKTIVLEIYNASVDTKPFVDRIKDIIEIN